MPEQREAAVYESGRATAPPGVCYTALAGSSSEGFAHTAATTPALTNLIDQNQSLGHSPLYTQNFTNFIHKRPQASPPCTANYSPCSSPNYPPSKPASKTSNLPFQSPEYSPSYPATSHNFTPPFSSPNYSTYNNSSINNSTINSSDNFELPSTSKSSLKSQISSYSSQDNSSFSSDHSLSFFNYSKISKSNSPVDSKNLSNNSNFTYFSNSSPKYIHNKDSVDLCPEEKPKKDLELIQKPLKTPKDHPGLNCNSGEIQFFPKHGSKVKNSQETNQDLVTDSFLHFLQKKNQEKNPQDNFSYDLGDISQILVSLTSKYKADENLGLKKRDTSEDSKLMNDFLTKIILEKEEKRFKAFDEKKKIVRKEIFDDLSNELDEKKIKRDAMSHYQEDKSHHKRSTNYGEFNQWDYLSQQDLQNSNNHNRRSHFSFCGTSQPHSMGWNPMGMNMPRQANPYYSNPHSHVTPAHAHTEYRYNQWNNPNHKNVPNMHNAHSQNAILPQTKHQGDILNSIQDFGLPLGSTSDLSKLRTSPLINTSSSPPTEKSIRSGIHSDNLPSMNPALRNPALRSPTTPSHSKSVLNNPLSDLQMLVTNQENENLTPKTDTYQQESVDLSAHSEITKHKGDSLREEDKDVSDNNKERKDLSSPVSVIQKQNKSPKNDFNVCEKPVELTSRIIEKIEETEISSSVNVNNAKEKSYSCEDVVENIIKNSEEKEESKSNEDSAKNSVTFENDSELPVNSDNNVANPTEVKNDMSTTEKTENTTIEENAKEEETSVTSIKESDGDKILNTEESSDNKKLDEAVPNNEIKENSENPKSCKRKAAEEDTDSEAKKVFLEVESQLEKMFEGIVEENSDLPTVSSTSAEVKPTPTGNTKKTPKKRPSRKSRVTRLSSGQSSSSESHFPLKKYKTLPKDDGKKKTKKSLCDVMDRRGPILHIEGSKESPTTVTVINFPKGDDEDEKDKSSSKKPASNAIRTKHHNELDYRGKSRNGLFCSTLSAKYDSHTTDHTWVCVFCKKGPHYNTLGDLFGPYIISQDENTSLCDFSGDEKDISDAQKRGGRNKKSLRSNNMVEHFQKMSKKLRRTQSTDSCLTGMTVISDDQVDQLRYEVWVHEQCAVWSPNVCLIGSRIVGMQEAIWCSIKTMCSKCGAFGANIGCVYRNCPNRSHYYCAKDSGWSLEQETFISMCHVHKPRS